MPCKHKLCFTCFKKMTKCPICRITYTRGDLTNKKIIYLNLLSKTDSTPSTPGSESDLSSSDMSDYEHERFDTSDLSDS